MKISNMHNVERTISWTLMYPTHLAPGILVPFPFATLPSMTFFFSSCERRTSLNTRTSLLWVPKYCFEEYSEMVMWKQMLLICRGLALLTERKQTIKRSYNFHGGRSLRLLFKRMIECYEKTDQMQESSHKQKGDGPSGGGWAKAQKKGKQNGNSRTVWVPA